MAITLDGTNGVTTPDLTVDTDTLTVDTTNNRVGIGTASPSYKFQIAAGTDHLITKAVSNLNSNIFFDTQNTSTGASANIVQRLITSNVAGTGTTSADFQKTKAGALNINNNETNSAAYTAFGVSGSERMRIDSGGNIFVGKTVNSYPVTGIKLGNNGRMQISTAVSDDNLALDKDVAGNFVYFSVNTGNVGTIYTNGSSTSYNTASDYRLKENVNYSFDATTRLKQLKPCRFNFITDVNTTVDGFLAHEVSQVVPEAVTGTKDATKQQDIINEDGEVIGTETVPDYQGIDQAKLVPLLVATIQELEARITALEAGNGS